MNFLERLFSDKRRCTKTAIDVFQRSKFASIDVMVSVSHHINSAKGTLSNLAEAFKVIFAEIIAVPVGCLGEERIEMRPPVDKSA